MKRKHWFITSLTVVVLVLGIGGGTVLAQEGSTNGDTPLKSFVSRVASILGLEEQQVQDAFQQAAKEIQDERVQRKLDLLVERGRLTQEQADEYKAWYDSRPEGLSPGFGSFGRHGLFRGSRGYGRGFCKHRAPAPEDSTATSSTDNAV